MDIDILGGVSAHTVQSGSAAASTPAPLAASSGQVSGLKNGENGANRVSANPTLEQVKQAVDNINKSLSEDGNAQSVQFSIDPDSKNVIVQVVDSQTKTVIRQIPSEDIIQMGRELGKRLGKVIDQTV